VVSRILSIAVLSALACLAEEQTATLAGTVTDILGMPVWTANAQLNSAENGLNFSAHADDQGQFSFNGIPPATYRLEIASPGFQSFRKTGIRLSVDQPTTVQNAILTIGGTCRTPAVDSIERLAPGDDSSSLRGSVFDSSDSPLSGVQVWLNCRRCTSRTDQDGHFSFSHLKPMSYTVTVSTIGFYREVFFYFVFKNQEWTYAPIRLEQCRIRGCDKAPPLLKIIPCM
jgi:hypothetical protein